MIRFIFFKSNNLTVPVKCNQIDISSEFIMESHTPSLITPRTIAQDTPLGNQDKRGNVLATQAPARLHASE